MLLAEARVTLAEEWNQKAPQTATEVLEFYQHAEHMVDDLEAWHELPSRQRITDALVKVANHIGAKKVLDCGAGMGHDLMAMACERVAVEPNLEFQQRLRNAGIRTYGTIDEVPDTDFDMVFTIDVMEHLTDPDDVLAKLAAKVRPLGILAERTMTIDTDVPLHLASNRSWHPGRMLDHMGFGFSDAFDVFLRFWQKVGGKRDAADEVLLCAYRAISPTTNQALINLAAAGWRHSIHTGDALISRVRSIAASKWFRETDGDVFLMIDDDIGFSVQDAEKLVSLAREKRSIACAAYATKDKDHLSCRLAWGDNDLSFGDVPPKEITYGATGFMAVHRDVLEAMIERMHLPFCHPRAVWGFWPFFQPLIIEDRVNGYEYLSEDWAFCERANKLGFNVWMDPSIILDHAGVSVYDLAGVEEQDVSV